MDSVDAVDMPDRETGRAGRLAEPVVWGPRRLWSRELDCWT